jgi:replicative DNA helicase
VTRNEAKEYIKNNYRFYFEQHLSNYEKSKKSYPLCPKCNEHELQTDPKKEGYYRCFKCGAYGDVFDYIGLEYSLSNFNDKFNKAIKLYGIIVDKESKIKETKDLHMEPKQNTNIINDEKKDYTKYYEEMRKNLKDTDYLTKRGISLEVQERFKIGFDPQWQSPQAIKKTKEEGKDISLIPATPRIIIPTSDYSYSARSTKDDGKYKMIKEGESHFFNPEFLVKKSDHVFIVEGEIDALSIIEAGGNSIGLGSTSNAKKLMEKLANKEITSSQLFILCLDNDDEGNKAAKEIGNFLDEQKIVCTNKTEEICEDCKDPNEALIKNPEKFKKIIKNIVSSIPKIHEQDTYEKENSDNFKKSLEYFKKENKGTETGFTELDKFLDGGFHQGLYILGALSGIGKTTFILQIADHIAEKRQGVLFFSGEMNVPEIHAKSLSRLSKKVSGDKKPLTAREIMNLKTSQEVRITELSKYYEKKILKNLKIIAGRPNLSEEDNKSITGTTIIREISKYKETYGKSPVMFIDYLQIMKFKKSQELRREIDNTISELRILSAKHEIPIILISSLNRAAAEQSTSKKSIELSSFKESGGIEYGADVVMVLEEKDGKNDTNSKTDTKVLKLRIIKNRLGNQHSKENEAIDFTFYYKYNYFGESKNNQKKSDKPIGSRKRNSHFPLYNTDT